MSYNISFRVKVEGINTYVEVGDCNANTTWNVREMIVKSTGLEWRNEANNGLVSEIIPSIAKGYKELWQCPKKYMQYEAENGWGTVKSTQRFFGEILKAWQELKIYEPDLARVATFWIT